MRGLVLAVCFAASTLAFAAVAGERAPLVVADVTAQQQQIRVQVAAGQGRYRDMPQSTRTELLERQAALLALLEGKASSDELSEAQRQEAFAALDWIEATISRSDDERMICKREKTLGSNLPARVCKPAAQWREEQEAARRALERACTGGACR